MRSEMGVIADRLASGSVLPAPPGPPPSIPIASNSIRQPIFAPSSDAQRIDNRQTHQRALPQTSTYSSQILPRLPPGMTHAQLEDAFLAALGRQSRESTTQLVEGFYQYTDEILPQPPGVSPLSQAILLTLFHRVSQLFLGFCEVLLMEIQIALALEETLGPEETFSKLATWLVLVSRLLDPRHPETANFFPRVVGVVEGILKGLIQNLRIRAPQDMNARNRIMTLQGISLFDLRSVGSLRVVITRISQLVLLQVRATKS